MKPQRLQPIRVLFLDHVPRMSGAEQSLCDLVEGLAHGPVEPVVVLPADGPLAAELRARGVLVRMVPMSKRMIETSRRTLASKPLTAIARMMAFIAAGLRIYRLVREIRPKIVHTNTLKSHLIAILPCKLARVPLVWHVRDILPDGWLRRAFLWCSRFASLVIVPSRAVAEPFKGYKNLHRKLRLIPNGVHVDDFQSAKSDRSLREMIGAAPSDPVVGIVARVAPWKGHDVFVRAAAMVADRYPRAHFVIVGAVLFPENDAAYEWQIQRMILDYGLEDRVSFLGWQPAPEAMAACDIVVHASLEPEPFGRTIIEAMAGGKPVIAAAGGAVQEILPPAAGFIVPPGRPELLADALDRLLEDKKLRKRMGDAGAAVADSFFPVARTVQGVAMLYRALMTQQTQREARRAARFPWLAKRRAAAEMKAKRKQSKQQQPAEQPLSWPRVPAGTDVPMRPASTSVPPAGVGRPMRGPGRSGSRRRGRAPERPAVEPSVAAFDDRPLPRRPGGVPPRVAPDMPPARRRMEANAPRVRAPRPHQPQPHQPQPHQPQPHQPQPHNQPPASEPAARAVPGPDLPSRAPAPARGRRSVPAARSARQRFIAQIEEATAGDPFTRGSLYETGAAQLDDADVDVVVDIDDMKVPMLSGAAGAATLAMPTPAEVDVAPPVAEPETSSYAPPASQPLPFALPPAEVFRKRPLYDAAKRALDLAVALTVLLVGSPVWLLIALLIKLDSPGPVFYTHTVYGRDCKPFRYYKFRSMRTDGDDRAHRTFIQRYVRENGGHDHNGAVVYKLMGDDRVTSVGRVIRALSLDEIPQLINVVLGQMSIVGPRPPLDYEYDLYDARAKLRLTVLPGITGLQQVEARHEASFVEKLRLDLEYVARRSILRDVAIMLRTIPAALRGH